MPQKRGTPSINTLIPPDTGLPQAGSRSPGSSFPRSVSPSTGFSQLFKPQKWFTRSVSSGAVPGRTSISSNEPRSSSSSVRKPKISHPTDPRPILDQLHPEPTLHIPSGSRSVYDLSLGRTATHYDDSQGGSVSRDLSSPSRGLTSRGLGDLRGMSRKPWSKSADDLGKLARPASPSLSLVDTLFQDKVQSYRNNRNDSVSSGNSPSPQSSTSYPFPVISTTTVETPSSSPPNRSGLLTSGSSSASPGTSPVTPLSQTSGHAHARSHSFTPRLPSKLTSPKLSMVPPSPKRKNYSASDAESSKDKVGQSSSNASSGSSSRAAFPFGFGGSSSGSRSASPMNIDVPTPLDRPGVSSSLLAPPTIVEPGSEDSKSEKRSSQLVYSQGFINRLMEFSPTALNSKAHQSYMSGYGGLTLAKGWKPFKLVLKGSKLYFYKPPSDRSAGIKELFPTELVVVLEDEGVTEEPQELQDFDISQRGGKGKEREEGRRKRAFWGSSTHPSLVFKDGAVEKGTYDSLIHEAVFHTTFRDPASADELSSGWRDFSSAIICALPAVVDRAQFENEFRRCCTMLVDTTGADERMQQTAREKVCWLGDLYVAYHGQPVESAAWGDWCNTTISNFPAPGEATSKPGGLSQSSSMQGLYSASPDVLSATEISGAVGSPDLGAFSPRPGGGDRIMSLLDALGGPPQPKAPAPSRIKPWHAVLNRNGFNRDILMNLDPQVIARSLYVHNLRALQKTPHNVTVTACLKSEHGEHPEHESTSVSDAPAPAHSPLAPFVGIDGELHWLTRIVLFQVLMSESTTAHSSSTFAGSSIDARSTHPTRIHTRSDAISAWARVAELCRRTGDECAWRAILSALCARPIARLDKVWKRVDGEALRITQSWVYPHDGQDTSKTTEPKTIPWAGDRILQMHSALNSAALRDSDDWIVDKLADAWRSYDSLRTDFSLASRQIDPKHNKDNADDVEILATHWDDLSSPDYLAGSLQTKFQRIDQFMSLSLAVEPRRKGMFEPLYWTRPPVQNSFHLLTPLLFPEPLPTAACINRSLLFRGRLDSTASTMNIQDLQYLRELHNVQPRVTSEAAKVNGFDLGGTVIMVYDGELMLLVQPADPATTSRPPSRPPSSSVEASPAEKSGFARNPSVRVKPGQKGLERKPSQLRRSSLPALSKKPSFEPESLSTERPLRVVIQAGTLERLVTVLVEGLHGVSVSVADDNGEMPLNDKKTRELRVDMDDFCKVWWNTFRSFITPHVFFELLRKKYVGAQVRSASPPSAEVAAVVRARTEVLEAISRWIHEGGGAQDALDDSQLHSAFVAFFNNPTEHVPVPEAAEVPQVRRGFATINENRKAVFQSFMLQTMRPVVRAVSSAELFSEQASVPLFGPEIPDFDQTKPEDLVNNMDAMAAAAFRNVTQEDLFFTADILEVQSADRIGWFLNRDPTSISDEVEIQSIHTYIQDIDISPTISELGQESLYRHLPPSVRTCIRAFAIIKRWLVSKVAAPRIGLKARQARMETLLHAIEIARRRNSEPGEGDRAAIEKPVIRSFVEAAIVSAILSVESRMYHRAWQTLSASRGSVCDNLASLLQKPAVERPVSREPLTVDMGWLLERMLEMISMPDILEQESNSLVNLDKRRLLHGLLTTNAHGSYRRSRHRVGDTKKDFERLNNIEHELSNFHFDLRAIREDAYREACQTPTPTSRKQPRPFHTLVSLQQEKYKRDRALRDRLSKEKRQEQQRQDKREEYLNKAMHVRRPQATSAKQHRTKKSSVSSAIMHFMRPISSAFISESVISTTKRTPAELDFVPLHKPAMVLNIVDARVSAFINNERSFTFQLDTEDGGHYLLQAMDKNEMKKWIETIDRVSKTAAKRRLTYMGQNSKMQMSDHLLGAGEASRNPKAVFGVDLETLLKRESPDGEISPGAVPSIIQRLIAEVESRGLTEVGIYRLAGAHSEVGVLRDALNQGEWPIDAYTDINAVCDLIKSWFRVLPDGMFPAPAHIKIMDAAVNEESDLDSRLANMRTVVHELPRTHFDLLKRLIEHLDKVTDFEENNQMTADSLATVFSPNLVRSAEDDVNFFFANMGKAHKATKMLISHAHIIFNDIELDLDADHEAESEDEYEHFDEPIPEEDEEDTELRSDDQDATDDDDPETQTVIAHPPVLDFTLPSPCDLSIPMPPTSP
ncbi:uncharacterized protein PHACADRAFT_198103 [Phanerochaete carnosa HHB-10118-sp]|uniref:Uncharacterized protein n=1 Tax=Phanerochaete carnosa (strain HHB-10118-sp) TaxID=650164 RepID=K5W408_PHACS|nr:uncharacterized protein PHACADRAFT_198103 [Phanerochaete carnosa HHB-10118-sp]EKM53679.1 hypothetical protein PHACADRAFT_198103 [Phanerochaete carnosa HHB-10118-sp]